jgi:hypothetical protein
MIVPCGISDKPVTSLAQEMEQTFAGRAKNVPSLEEVAEMTSRNFGRIFEAQTLWLDSLNDLLATASPTIETTSPANQDTPARAPEAIRRLAGEKDMFSA